MLYSCKPFYRFWCCIVNELGMSVLSLSLSVFFGRHRDFEREDARRLRLTFHSHSYFLIEPFILFACARHLWETIAFFFSLSFNIFLSLLLAPTIEENWKADLIPPSFLNFHLIGNAKLDGATDKRLKNLIWDSRVRTRAGSCARKRETTERRRRAVTLLERGKIKTSRPAERVGSSSPGELPIESARFCRNEKKPVFPFRPGEKEKGEKYMNSVTSGMIIGREMFYQNRNEGRK